MNDFVFNGCHYLCDYVKVPQNHTLPPQMSVLLLFADFFFFLWWWPTVGKNLEGYAAGKEKNHL